MFTNINNLSKGEQNALLYSSPDTIKLVSYLYDNEKKSFTGSATVAANVSKTYIKSVFHPNKIDPMFVGSLQKVFQKTRGDSYAMISIIDCF